jgi:[ribosomal protein S5]-alanine N-acetyltransferase
MLTLVPSIPEYAELFYQWRQDPEARSLNPMKNHTAEELKERLFSSSSNIQEFGKKNEFLWFVKNDQKLVGNVSFAVNLQMLTAEIAYAIAPISRGNGYGEKALKLMLNEVFSATPLRKLIAYVHEDNLASRRILEKIGFKKEGFLRGHFLIEGMPANEIIFGLLRQDY